MKSHHLEPVVCALLLGAIFIALVIKISLLDSKNDELKEEIRYYEHKVEHIEDNNKELEKELDALKDTINKLIDTLELGYYKITKYAPLCEEAIPGWDYSGDPSITASGDKVIPGDTVAAGPDLSFGDVVYIEGIGRRIVNDRGGRVGTGHIDVATHSKQQAQEWGVRSRKVLVKRVGE